MRNAAAVASLSLVFAIMATQAPGQKPSPTVPKIAAPQAAEHDSTIRIDVQVSTKKGDPVPGLKQTEFTVLDNNQPRQISSFRQLGRTGQQVEAILVLDAVNTRFENVSYERTQLDKFLKQSGAKTAIPMTLAVLTDKGLQVQRNFTQDTSVLSNLVQNSEIELRQITRAAGFWGADERMDTSINAMQQLVPYAAGLPGRKLILYLSPGWPLLSGPDVQLDSKERTQVFNNVVAFSSLTRHGNITLDALNPLGPGESLVQENYYMAFMKGLRAPNQADLGDLSVQVLAIHSGGLVTNSTDIAGTIAKALEDSDVWYEITFQAPSTETSNDYHHLDVKLDQPGLVVRTPDGYYDQPRTAAPGR